MERRFGGPPPRGHAGTVRPSLSRELVVGAARATLEEDGVDHLSLRALARKLGVTAPALYAYVEDRDDLLAAVATDHFESLLDRFAEVPDDTAPLDRIRELGRTYVEHALASPALFRLMFRYPPRAVAGIDPFPPAARAFEAAASATAAAVESGDLVVEDVALASMTMWAAVHGAAEVLLLGFGDEEFGSALVASVIDTVLAGQTGSRAPG
jgi:AcrR family transcriptional regulator